MSDVRIDLMSPEFRENPYPFYRELRDRDPVHQLGGAPFYIVSRYADVEYLFKHHELFSSLAMGGVTSGGITGLGESMPASLRRRPMMIGMDPPDHTRLRNLVNRGFTPRAIASWGPRIREISQQLMDELAPKGELELIRDFAIPLPVTVIAELLGVEPERRDDFKRWSDAVILATGTNREALMSPWVAQAMRDFADYFGAAIEKRRSNPTDDLIGVLVKAETEDGALTPDELLGFCLLLLVAGNETTTNLIGNGVLALLNHPAELERVQGDLSLVPRMIEEILRYDGPIQALARIVTQDTELAGRKLPKGAYVMPRMGAANRDERRFEDPDRFDPLRRSDAHLGFGLGIHFCLGASLARLEGKHAFEAMLPRLHNLRMGSGEVRHFDSLLIRGPVSVPLSFDPR